jgi:hypothetical protein
MPDFGSIRFLANRPLLNEISADRLNSILQEIKRNKPLPGRGITLRQEGNGVRVDLAASISGSSSTPATTQPWDLVAQVDPDAAPENPNPPYLVRVRPGTLNGILPKQLGHRGGVRWHWPVLRQGRGGDRRRGHNWRDY